MMLRVISMAQLLLIFLSAPMSFAGGYPGFKELKQSKCVPLDPALVKKLPGDWKKYDSYIKICPLAKSNESPAKVSVISIWANDYLDSKGKTVWENFPLPLLVDEYLKEIGNLPEIYPMDSRTEPLIYYGKWKSGLPSEIRVDVHNPTVSGDYYYLPQTWNVKAKRYSFIDKEPRFGPRPKH